MPQTSEHEREYKRAWYVANRDRERAKQRARNIANPFPNRERARLWRLAHPGHASKKAREWKLAHPEAAAVLRRRYRQKNADRLRENLREYRRRNPEIAAAQFARRRDAKAGITTVIRLYGDICYVCGRFLDGDRTLGHEPPLFRCAKEGWTTVFERPEHKSCNIRKGTRLDSELPPEFFV